MLTMVISLRSVQDDPRPPEEALTLLGLLDRWPAEKLLVLGSGPLPVDAASRGLWRSIPTGTPSLS